MKDWLLELGVPEWQAEIIAEQVRIRVESEREQCAQLVENFYTSNPNLVAETIRSMK